MKVGNTVATLDIGSTKIVATICRTGEDLQTEVIGLCQKPFASQTGGIMTNIDAASNTIRQTVEHAELMSGETVESLVVSISGLPTNGQASKGIVAIAGDGMRTEKETRQVSMPDIMRAIEMAESISIGSEQIILHSIPTSFIVDSLKVEEPLGAAGVRLEIDVYLVLANRAALENVEKAVTLAGYNMQDITLQSMAASEAILSNDEKKSGALVFDIGGSESDLVFYKNNAVVFTDAISVGSNHISKDLAYGLRTSLQTAEEVKLKHGVASAGNVSESDFITVSMLSYKKTSRIARRAVAQIIEARIEEIFTLAKSALHQATILDKLESGIVLTGAGSLLPGMVEAAEEFFAVPVRIGEPLDVTSISEDSSHPSNATSVGLAKLALSRRETPSTSEVPTIKKDSRWRSYLKKFFN